MFSNFGRLHGRHWKQGWEKWETWTKRLGDKGGRHVKTSFYGLKMDLKCLFGSDKKEIKVREVLNMAKLFVS